MDQSVKTVVDEGLKLKAFAQLLGSFLRCLFFLVTDKFLIFFFEYFDK